MISLGYMIIRIGLFMSTYYYFQNESYCIVDSSTWFSKKTQVKDKYVSWQMVKREI